MQYTKEKEEMDVRRRDESREGSIDRLFKTGQESKCTRAGLPRLTTNMVMVRYG